MKSICCTRTVKGTIALVAVSTLVIVLGILLLATGSQLLAMILGKYDGSLNLIVTTLVFVLLGAVFFVIACLWNYIWMLQKCLICCFPVACGHRRCICTGKSFRDFLFFLPAACGHKTERNLKNLREILLSVDKAIPTEEQLQEFTDNALHYLNDAKTALEKKMGAEEFHFVFSGSVFERFGIPVMTLYKTAGWRASVQALRTVAPLDADVDVMFCSLAMEYQASFSDQGNILIEPLVPARKGFTGYVQLVCMKPGVKRKSFSSEKIKRKVHNAIRTMPVVNLPGFRCCCVNTHLPSMISLYPEGPTMKLCIQQHFEVDITICLKCSEWPPMSDWPSRPRTWPSLDDAQRIISLGCHLVPKSAPYDKKRESWRFSFSLAEVELSKLVPDTARKCYLALKIIYKDHLKPVMPRMIKSYHIKTIFLNTLEKMPVGFWVESNIENCFLTLLAELRYALLFMKCPHHWFSSVNLFDHLTTFSCIRKIRLQLLAKKVQTIMNNPAPFIFYDGCCSLCPCYFRAPPYSFTRPTSEEFLVEYEEVMLSADGHVIPAAPHCVGSSEVPQCQPSVSSSARCEAELDPSFCSLSENHSQENTTGPERLEVYVPPIHSL